MQTLVSLEGTQSEPVKGVTLSGLTFRDAAQSYMVSKRAFPVDVQPPLQYCLVTPELQWQPRGKMDISQGWVLTGNARGNL
jgi:hypothetical protein